VSRIRTAGGKARVGGKMLQPQAHEVVALEQHIAAACRQGLPFSGEGYTPTGVGFPILAT
jgi:hypothetical protein